MQAPDLIRASYSRAPLEAVQRVVDDSDFEGEVSRRAVPGIRALERVRTPSVESRRQRATDTRGIPEIAVPCEWDEAEEQVVLPDLWFLREAAVFGGTILGRNPSHHWHGQLVTTRSSRLIPASFGSMDGNVTLPRGMVREGEAEDLEIVRPAVAPRFLGGTYVLLGSVHRHWGHAILEGLTRLWVMPLLDIPVKWLIYEDRVPEFASDLLRLAGIAQADVVYATAYDVVERLIVPDVGMRTHRWITTAQADAWDLLRVPADPTRRVYLSRAGVPSRKCVDEGKVEEIFLRAGWEIVRPEQLSVRDQLALAGQSAQLAGLVGSQMYLAAFQPDGGRNIVIAPQNFFLRDDLLVGAARSHDVNVIFGGSVRASDPHRRWRLDGISLSQIVEAANR